ncbi:MAG TPA: hypothetical protein DCE78_07785 [Bacteroidetes bacterium]|nr:hypothetical protein [Bacteroidota bacterium]
MEPYSGNQAKVYSIIPEGSEDTLFEKFVDEFKSEFKDEIKDILKRLMQIGHYTGARESFFKHEGDKELYWSDDGTELEGNLKNYNYE